MTVTVIIPAAGLGTRMVSATRTTAKPAQATKQFAELNGVPVLVHTLRKFTQIAEVGEIIIAMREVDVEPFRGRLEQERIGKSLRIVEGGEHRQESVSNALAAVTAAPDDVILVHDAVRPFIEPETIRDVIDAAQKYGAAIAAIPAVDTVKQVERTAEGAVVRTTIPREHIVLVQTPQGFRYEVLKRAFEEAANDGFIGTDEASVVERSGHEVWVVMGSPRNIKITTPADMELAEFFMAQDERRRCSVSG